MKKIIAYLIIVMIGIGITDTYAQQDTLKKKKGKVLSISAEDKSSTVSALCIAQEEVVKEILAELYICSGDTAIDIIQAYDELIKIRIARCLKIDIVQTGIKVRDNALEGKFKKIKLKFEKPSDNKFKIYRKVKRQYKRAYKETKKSFIKDRKTMTLDDILDQPNLIKKINKVGTAMTERFKRDIKKVSK